MGRRRTAPAPRPSARTDWRTRVRRATGRDGNPMRRPVDRVRTLLTLVVAVLALLGTALSAVAAFTLYRADLHTAAELAAHRHRVPATTTAAARTDGLWLENTAGQRVQAHWQYPPGHRHTGEIMVPAGTAAGTAIPTWVDDGGRLAAMPRSTGDVATGAALSGLMVLSGAAMVCGGVLVLGRRRIDLRTAAAWEREWERVEPGWSGRSRSA